MTRPIPSLALFPGDNPFLEVGDPQGNATNDAHVAVRAVQSLKASCGMGQESVPNWREHGVKVIPGSALDVNTPQTPGMARAAAITSARTGAAKLWAGTVTIHANAKTGAHHHGELESVIYVVSGRARMRWGERLEFTAEAGPGDFIYVPPFVPHQEINASPTEVLECVLVRSGGEAVIVNLDIRPAEPPEEVPWVDSIHPESRLPGR